MFNYIRADLYRILHKRSNLVYWIVLAALFVIIAVLSATSYQGNLTELTVIYYELAGSGLLVAGMLLVCPQFYYAVYLDELSNKNFIRIFSSGLRKSEYILAKIMVSVIYMLTVFVFLTIIYMLTFLIIMLFNHGVPFLSFAQITQLLAVVGYLMLFTLAFSALTNVISLKLQNSNISLSLFFITSLGLASSLVGLVNRLPLINRIDLDPYLLSTNMDTLLARLTETMSIAGKSGNSSKGGFAAAFSISQGIGTINAKPFIIIGSYLIVSTLLSFLVLQHSDIKEN
ncbi:MAG TPA: hypothetical protein VK118_04010 [Tetragenococcus sp.]|nr:hypothetical protein [Tetragenococcus sp.]